MVGVGEPCTLRTKNLLQDLLSDTALAYSFRVGTHIRMLSFDYAGRAPTDKVPAEVSLTAGSSSIFFIHPINL